MQQLLANRYEVYERLGAGGMGTVFRVVDRLSDQSMALKRLLLPGTTVDGKTSTSEDVLLSLAREFRALATLHHPNVIAVNDYGFDGEQQPYFTMELMSSPQTLTEAGAKLDTGGKVRLLLEVLQGLAYIHRRGIVHQDLKPPNVLVDATGRVKILDFGLALQQARETDADVKDSSGGTLAYMAPERFMEEKATVASDLYAVGVMGYELLAGRFPFNMNSTATLLNDILFGKPDYSILDNAVAPVLQTLLSKNPVERYPDAESAIAALCQATGQAVPSETLEIRESYLQASNFVGRDAELNRLMEALQAAQKGNGSSWLVAGESGTGKSRLLDELRMRALVRGALVLRGNGVAEGGLPYQLWREPIRRLVLSTTLSDLEAGILKEVVPDIARLLGRDVPDAPPLQGEPARSRLSLTIVDMFKRQTQPILLLLEDLQWADESLVPLKALNQFVGEFPWFIVSSYRSEEASDLPAKLPDMQVLNLSRLSDSAIAELSASMLGASNSQPELLDLLKRETEGNTLFMVEIIRTLAEQAGTLRNIGHVPLPAQVTAGGVLSVLKRRLNRVPGWAQSALQLAGVAGRQLDLKVLNNLTPGLDWEAWLNTCANVGVLERIEGQWRFTHDKLRETLLSDLQGTERRNLHREIAVGLEQVYGSDSAYAESLADHWYAAGEINQAAAYTLEAARRLITITANYGRSEQLLKRMLASPIRAEYRPRLMRWLGSAYEKQNRFSESLNAYQECLASANEDQAVQAFALGGKSWVEFCQGEYEQAEQDASRGVEIGRAIGDLSAASSNLMNLAILASSQGQYEQAVTYYHECLELDRQVGNRHGMARALNNWGIAAMYKGDYDAAQSHLQASLSMDRELGNRHGMAGALTNLGIVANEQGQYEQAIAYNQQSLDLYRQIGYRYGIANALDNLGGAEIYAGRYPAAEAHLEESLSIRRELGVRVGIAACLCNLGIIANAQHQSELAARRYQESLDIYRELGDRHGEVVVLLNLASVAMNQQQYPEAISRHEASLEIAREIGDESSVATNLSGLAYARTCLNDMDAAWKAALEGLSLARKVESTSMCLDCLASLALWFARNGQEVRSVELAALVDAHPSTEAIVRSHRITPLLKELEPLLEPAQFTTALEQGRGRDVNEVMDELLSDAPNHSVSVHE
jgi:tetratricopeptide (TPR) repeat protein